MKTWLRCVRWSLLAVLSLLVTSATDVLAQTVPRAKTEFTIKRIEFRLVNAPAAGGGERGAREAAQIPWARFECEFDSQPDWTDDVQVKWYVVLTGRTKVMATGDDTYIYVKKGRRHVARMYMHPFVMERWTGTTAQNAIEDVGVEIWHAGRLVVFSSARSQTKTQWWQQFTPQPGLLMRVSESPWATSDYAEQEWSKYTTSKSQ